MTYNNLSNTNSPVSTPKVLVKKKSIFIRDRNDSNFWFYIKFFVL